jgi:hypothetical protein
MKSTDAEERRKEESSKGTKKNKNITTNRRATAKAKWNERERTERSTAMPAETTSQPSVTSS